MRVLVPLIAAAGLAATPVPAQQDPGQGDPGDIRDGMEMLSEGARRLLRGLMGEVEPEMRDLADDLRNWNFEGLGVDDLGQYEPPEILPNGDIIIRRKEPLDEAPPLPAPGEDDIEL